MNFELESARGRDSDKEHHDPTIGWAQPELSFHVTGASDFIASHVVRQLLEKGEKVHATVQNTKNTAKIQHLHGTQNVLDAVQKIESVKTVILTSSCAAIYGDNADMLEMKDRTMTTEYFNTSNFVQHNAYSYSKTVAEQEAWKIYEAQAKPPRCLSLLDQILCGQFFAGVPDLHFALVDVRKVATTHIRAAENADAHGRYILTHDASNSLVDITRMLRPITKLSLVPKHTLPNMVVRLAGPFLGFSQDWLRKNLSISFKADNRPSQEQLGIEYRPLEETVADHYESWKKAKSR
ncbi:hypothetical protein N7539_008430 [Penicillium diatomitis]|uniref:NAD-dependent epimerase/dehydratase domain-containing protein n=1 Tax=Penicillium diatomitis TaxID=2819901 RepID=A0A9X0BNB2_9EURO|nr:uncharacterized protein N7539_008430 [Penicillium diatomitis]KAJ5475364.1 hypothetical protein N7539_008430 [Penicillium diatomitis]